MTTTTFAFAEPEGYEHFVPRKADHGRSLEILHETATWYGATVEVDDNTAKRLLRESAERWLKDAHERNRAALDRLDDED